MTTISIKDYAKIIGFKDEKPTIETIQKYAQEYLDFTIWDYPLEEYDYVLNEVHEGNKEELVLVDTNFGIRVCEI